MSVRDSFVTEKEIEEDRKRRKEEWDRVRQPGQPEEPPEPQDSRPLYERLKEQREHKQLEYEEAHKLKNMLRGLDSEEVGFLDYVDKMKKEEEDKRLNEERALLSEVKKQAADSELDPVNFAKINELTRRPIQASASKARERSKQAQLLAGVVKKRKAQDEADGEVEPKKSNSNSDDQQSSESDVAVDCICPSATIVAGVRLSATSRVGVLPGLESYEGDSSDDSSNSSSSDAEDAGSCMFYMTPVQLKLERQQQKQTESRSNCDSAQ